MTVTVGRQGGNIKREAPFASRSGRMADMLHRALLDSRQRWRDLVGMATDIAFETDVAGNLVFLAPQTVLGWNAASLIGQSADVLLADDGRGGQFNPFRSNAPVRSRRAWLRRADGGKACIAFAAAPLLDEHGRVVGARGAGRDTTEQETHALAVAATLRRSEMLDHILRPMREEVLAPRMLAGTLEALWQAVGAEGAALLDALLADEGTRAARHVAGELPACVADAGARALLSDGEAPSRTQSSEGHDILVVPCVTKFGERSGLVLWRQPGGRPWDDEEKRLIASTAWVLRVALEQEQIQREMIRQARVDGLTGLLNRAAFLEECARRLDRLDREGLHATLLLVDLDGFRALNEARGHEAGDEALRLTAGMLRSTFRPTDLAARLGGDEFAIWLDGADELTAAERAESLRLRAPDEFGHLTSARANAPRLSIGIACRRIDGGEALDSLIRRADGALRTVKHGGGGQWRVSREEPIP